jgi:hypothetical protein
MHLRLAELMENSDPSLEDVKYIIDLLQGKAELPPQLLPDEIHGALRARGEIAGGPEFIEGMFNPFRFTNPINTANRNRVVQALGTNVLGKGFLDRWRAGETHYGPRNLREWTEYFVNRALGNNPGIGGMLNNQGF